MIDTAHWFGLVPEGCDVPGWVPYMTAAELGFNHPKLAIDFKSGETFVSFPHEPVEAPNEFGNADEAA